MSEQAKEAVATEATDNGKTTVRPDVSKYTKAKAASGAASHHNGDVVASGIAGMTVEEVASVAVKMTGVEELATKYNHLNVGMQRMNLGNKIRGAIANVDKANEKKVAAKVKEAGEGVNAEEIAAELKLPTGEDKFNKIVAPMREAVDARAKKAADEKAAKDAERKAKADEKARKEAVKAAKADEKPKAEKKAK